MFEEEELIWLIFLNKILLATEIKMDGMGSKGKQRKQLDFMWQ